MWHDEATSEELELEFTAATTFAEMSARVAEVAGIPLATLSICRVRFCRSPRHRFCSRTDARPSTRAQVEPRNLCQMGRGEGEANAPLFTTGLNASSRLTAESLPSGDHRVS